METVRTAAAEKREIRLTARQREKSPSRPPAPGIEWETLLLDGTTHFQVHKMFHVAFLQLRKTAVPPSPHFRSVAHEQRARNLESVIKTPRVASRKMEWGGREGDAVQDHRRAVGGAPLSLSQRPPFGSLIQHTRKGKMYSVTFRPH